MFLFSVRSIFSTIICAIICTNVVFAIVGGRDSIRGKFPYIVSIRDYSSMEHYCGGSIISDKHIITAAHCLQGNHATAANIFAVVGAMRREGDGISMEIANIYSHLNFSEKPLRNDIGMLYTVEKIQFNGDVKPIALPRFDIPRNGAFPVLLSGFGRLWGPTPPDFQMNKPHYLQWIQSLTVDREQCLSQFDRLTDKATNEWLKNDGIDTAMSCAIGQNDQGSCIGDSGGPLATQDNHILIGIISWSFGCARGYPDVYTNVYMQLDWIKQAMKPKSHGFFNDIMNYLQSNK